MRTPTIKPQEKKLKVDLTAQGHATLKRKAAAAGKPVSTYVREILGVESPHDLTYKRRTPIPETLQLSDQAQIPGQVQA
ncbi:hypothetical protein [Nostoc sp.]|uniref:hypothetical protein n=1 Tax=Nostoc sp. TaxID=1180 RepID=UPI002FF9BAF7